MGVQPHRAFIQKGPPLGLILVTVLKLLIIFEEGAQCVHVALAPVNYMRADKSRDRIFLKHSKS